MRHSAPPIPYRFDVARAAMAKLMRDPDDTAQVFAIIEALSGNNGQHTLDRFRMHAKGRRLLARKQPLLPTLQDHAYLRSLPEGSLGRAYLDFLATENISAQGLIQASVDGRTQHRDSDDLAFVGDYLRDSHDLWHAVTGYRGDLVGEAALLAFTFTQTWNPGVGFIVLMGLLKGLRTPSIAAVILGGLRRGLLCRWLPAQEWLALLPLPLDEVRRRLNVAAAPGYQQVRPVDLGPTNLA